MNVRLSLTALLLAGLLVGCNDSDTTTTEPVAQQKMGYGESELYDPIHNPQGALLPEGATAVLFLEASGGPLVEGDTGGVGYDELWFEWPEPTVLWMFMEDQDLGVIARVELWDTSGGLHLVVDAERRYGEVELPAGIYGLRLYAAHDEPAPMSAFIRYELGDQTVNGQHVSIQANASDLQMTMQYRYCEKCDLAHADLRGANLTGAKLAGANLWNASMFLTNLTKANLYEANLTEAYLRDANLRGADLYGADLYGADLTFAKLSWATLNKANLTAAILAHADLTGANL
ncbi:MAG: pentapeptide repeat-containing protein, partial [Chromatiales bacterium]|nr:pentapeptide repeat-containing protein [Chromatiales bacterium]